MQCLLVPYHIFGDSNNYKYIIAMIDEQANKDDAVILLSKYLIERYTHLSIDSFISKLKQFGVIPLDFNDIFEFVLSDDTNKEEIVTFINSCFLLDDLKS